MENKGFSDGESEKRESLASRPSKEIGQLSRTTIFLEAHRDSKTSAASNDSKVISIVRSIKSSHTVASGKPRLVLDTQLYFCLMFLGALSLLPFQA